MMNYDMDEKYILPEMIVGIIVINAILAIPVAIFLDGVVYNLLGLLYGVIVAIAMSAHMWNSVERALELNESDARRHMVKSYMLRTFIAIAVVIFVAILGVGNYFLTFIGILSLKVSAYIQPLTHKFFKKYIAKGE